MQNERGQNTHGQGEQVKIPLLPNIVGEKSVNEAGPQPGHDKFLNQSEFFCVFQLNNGSACGSFSPMLFALKISTDKLSNIHNQWTHKLLDLVR